MDELIEKRNRYLREFWYGYRLHVLTNWRPVYGSKTYFTLLRLDDVFRLALKLEACIAES